MVLAIFHPFPRLPPEIRQKVWDDALEEESNHRFVLFNWKRRRVGPRPSLISPLLKVDTESRTRALALYTLKLNVLRKPAASMAADLPSAFFRAYEPSELELAGAIYLNPDRDIFVKLDHITNPLDPLYHSQNDDGATGVDLALRRYTTERMNVQRCSLVRRCLDTMIDLYAYEPSCTGCSSAQCFMCSPNFSLAKPHLAVRRSNVFPQLKEDILFCGSCDDVMTKFAQHVMRMCQCEFFRTFKARIETHPYKAAQLRDGEECWDDDIDPAYEDSDREIQDYLDVDDEDEDD